MLSRRTPALPIAARGVLLSLLGLGGCAWVIGIEHRPPATEANDGATDSPGPSVPPEASADAARGCMDLAVDPTFTDGWRATAVSGAVDAGSVGDPGEPGLTVEVTPAGYGQAFVDHRIASPDGGELRLRFALAISGAPMFAVVGCGLVLTDVRDTFDSPRTLADFRIEPGQPPLRVQTYTENVSPAGSRDQDLLPSYPPAWIDVELRLQARDGQATVRASASLRDGSSPAPGPANVDVGSVPAPEEATTKIRCGVHFANNATDGGTLGVTLARVRAEICP